MINETELRNKALDLLVANLGRDNTQDFLKMIARESGDYSKWRKYLFYGMTLEEINEEATKNWDAKKTSELVS